jgi:hypothetical protein
MGEGSPVVQMHSCHKLCRPHNNPKPFSTSTVFVVVVARSWRAGLPQLIKLLCTVQAVPGIGGWLPNSQRLPVENTTAPITE